MKTTRKTLAIRIPKKTKDLLWKKAKEVTQKTGLPTTPSRLALKYITEGLGANELRS